MRQQAKLIQAPVAVAHGTVQLFIAQIIFLLSGFVISVILARGLGPAEFGVYGVFISLLTWVEMVLNAGIPSATAKLLPQYESQATVVEQAARFLLLGWGLLLFLLCWAAAPALAQWLGISSGAMLWRLAILDIPLMAVYFSYQGILNGHGLFGILSLSLIIHTLAKLAGILVLLFIGLSVTAVLVAHVLATIAMLIYLVKKFSPSLTTRPSWTLMQSMLRIAVPIGLYLIALQILLGVGVWFLKSLWTGSGEVVGHYVAALNVSRVFTVIPSALSGLLLASLSRALAKSNESMAQSYVQGATRFALVFVMPGCVLLLVDAEQVMALLYSDKYRPGAILLRYQVVTFGAVAFLDIFCNSLMAARRVAYSATILVGLIPLALALTVALIPAYGGVGAAFSLLCSIGLGTVIATVLAYRRFGALVTRATLVRVSLAAGVVAVLAVQFPAVGHWLLLKFMALLGCYVVVLGLLKELSRSDLHPFAIWQTGRPKASNDLI